jgi:hypothetical protein
MALHSAFGVLDRRVADLEQSLEMLQWAVIQAKPEHRPTNALLDRYESTTLDLMSLAHDTRDAAGRGLRATQGSVDAIATRDALATVSDRYNQLWARLCADSCSIEAVEHLNDIRKSGTAWRRWADGVSDALSHCPSTLFEVGQALARCWEDLFEGVSIPPLSLHVIGSGQPSALSGGVESE